MDDLIKRCDVIKDINEGADLLRTVLDEMDLVGIEREKFGYGLGLLEALIDDIKQLPSAQPYKEPYIIKINKRTEGDIKRMLQKIVEEPLVLFPTEEYEVIPQIIRCKDGENGLLR